MSTVEEVRGVTRGAGATITALISGSMVLAGKICGCAGHVLVWAWDQASTDTEATDAAQAKADKAAKAKGGRARNTDAGASSGDGSEPGDDDPEQEEVTVPRVRPVRRPALESVGMLALAGMLVAGAAGTAGALIAPYLGLLAPWRPVIISVGGVGWMVAAWMVAPPPKPTADATDNAQGEESEEAGERPETAEDRGTALLWHVLRALADAESAGRAGLHLDVVLDSATAAGLVPEDTEQPAFRGWVESCGLPTADKVGMRIGGKPVTRVGLRIDAATEALGMTPLALLRARAATPAGGAAATPAQPVGETPASTPDQAPAGVPVPAALRLIPGGRLDPDQTPSPPLSQEKAQEAR
ncbi:hypothetical protein [Streptomyces sp. NPDC058394]|uniref:hypothetical protein n=1 Tax=Streptomyces sp. NPDC058394 TaxID=3346477 RepID=UPI00365C2CD1